MCGTGKPVSFVSNTLSIVAYCDIDFTHRVIERGVIELRRPTSRQGSLTSNECHPIQNDLRESPKIFYHPVLSTCASHGMFARTPVFEPGGPGSIPGGVKDFSLYP